MQRAHKGWGTQIGVMMGHPDRFDFVEHPDRFDFVEYPDWFDFGWCPDWVDFVEYSDLV